MQFDNTKYKLWTPKSPYMLFRIIDPISAFSELILGKRTPKVMLVEKDSEKISLQDKAIIPCPHCHTMHPGLTWSVQNHTENKNWFGLYCNNCGQIIPCITNLTSYLILAITSPIWYWFRDKWKEIWLKKQPERFKNINVEYYVNPYAGTGWIKEGLSWGLYMFVFITFILPLLLPSLFLERFTLRSIYIGLTTCTLAGFGLGYQMKLKSKPKKPKPEHT